MDNYKYEKCVDCVHAHMNKDGNHDCGFEDCVSEKDKRYPDDTPFESYRSSYDTFMKMVALEKLDKAKEIIKRYLDCGNMWNVRSNDFLGIDARRRRFLKRGIGYGI